MCSREKEIGHGVKKKKKKFFLDVEWTVCVSKVMTEQRVGESRNNTAENEKHSEEG